MDIVCWVLIPCALLLYICSYINDKKIKVLCNRLNEILLGSSELDFNIVHVDGDWVKFVYERNVGIPIAINLSTNLAYVDTGRIVYTDSKLFFKLYEIYKKHN